MIRTSVWCILFLILTSCGASKKRISSTKTRKVTVTADKKIKTSNNIPLVAKEEVVSKITKADAIIATSLTFANVRYKYGGTTRKGMDCSGLLYTSFKAHDILLPRVSYAMAEKGTLIKLKEITKGDLLFFKTNRKGKRINHVGMVVAIEGNNIKFIHATSSRGVIVSSLKEGFWNYTFVKAKRIL